MDKLKEDSQINNEVSEAVALLSGQAQRTLAHELRKAQNSPNPPFFLKLKRPKDGIIDEEFEKDHTELQNFAEVLAETMAQLLKQAEQTLLEKLKNTRSMDRSNGEVQNPKQREDEVRNFSLIFAETRTKLVDDVKGLVKELRKDQGNEESSPKKEESLFSILGVDDVALDIRPQKGTKRHLPPSSNYDPGRDTSKKPRISPPKRKPGNKQPSSSLEDVCYICEEKGHRSYQCTKPDTRKCYTCNKTGHISTQCSKADRSCSICKEEGHLKSECKKYRLIRDNSRRSRSRSPERSRSSKSSSRERSYSRESSYSEIRR